MQLPEQGGRHGGLGLGGLEWMLGTGGQVGVAGGVDEVVQGSPDGPPRGKAESGAAGAGEAGLAGERPGQSFPGGEAGKFDDGAGGGGPVQVAGFGQDRRRTDRRTGP